VRVVKRITVRNKIDLADPAHVRAWTRRLKLSRKELQLIIDKVGNSASAIMKEIVLQRAAAEHDTEQPLEGAK
jgi:ribosome biogenesis GTPase A